MKKAIITLLICSAHLLNVQAQENRKPVKGTITSQVGLSIGSWTNISSMGLNGRYFLTSSLAPRLSINMSNYSYTSNFSQFSDGSGNKGSYTSTNNSTNWLIGVEKHFRGSNKLSPFFGLEFGFGSGKLKTKGENSSGYNYRSNYNEEGEQKSSTTNINAFLGFDYWINSDLYLGIENRLYSFSAYNNKDGENNITDNGISTKVFRPGSKYSTSSTINVVPTFRLGWKF